MRRPLTRWNHYQQTRKQTRTALRLLTLSGVVRPGTSEPRYIIVPVHVAARREQHQSPAPNQAQSPLHPPQMHQAMSRLHATAAAWAEQSTYHLRQLHWMMEKAAWRIIGIPSVR